MNMEQHNFRKSLKKSEEVARAEWWNDIYKTAFPSMISTEIVSKDGWAQRGGIDRVVVLSSGRTLYIEEKVRDEDWPDFALEIRSDVYRKTPGWINKDLACDYLAYVFKPSRRCFMLPWQMLRTAWLREGKTWIDKARGNHNGFSVKDAQNDGYKTRVVCVPINEVLTAIRQSMTVVYVDNQPPITHYEKSEAFSREN